MSPTTKTIAGGVTAALLAGGVAYAHEAEWVDELWKNVITVAVSAGVITVVAILFIESLQKRLAATGFLICMSLAGACVAETAFGDWRVEGEIETEGTLSITDGDSSDDPAAEGGGAASGAVGVTHGEQNTWREGLVSGLTAAMFLAFAVVFLGKVAEQNNDERIAKAVEAILQERATQGTYCISIVAIYLVFGKPDLLQQLMALLGIGLPK